MSDGTVKSWGRKSQGGGSAPTGNGFSEKILGSRYGNFAAIKSDGSVKAWGDNTYGGWAATAVPSITSGAVELSHAGQAWAVLMSDGSIKSWGRNGKGGDGAPSGTGFVKIVGSTYAFAALKSDGSVTVWGDTGTGGSDPSLSCLLYTSPSPRDGLLSRMPSSA